MSKSLAEKRAAVCSIQARRLFSLVCDTIAASPDRSCYASEKWLARTIGIRKATVHAAKYELIEAGALDLTLRQNGNRKNPRHRLTLPQRQPRQRATPGMLTSGVPGCSGVPADTCGYRPLYALGLWGECDRVTQVELYLRSGLNICALAPYQKKPIWSKAFAARLTIDQKIDTFYQDESLGVGLWLDDRFEVFDLDSGGHMPPDNTLVSIRGDHSHVYFAASGTIHNATKIAPGIDTRACGGLLVLPPTVHKSGDSYRWQNVTNPIVVPPEYMALWRNRRVEGEATGFRLEYLPEVIPHGQRDNTLWTYGRSLRAAGCDHEYIRSRLRYLNLERCKPPLPSDEIEFKINHILTWRNRSDFVPKGITSK